MTSNVKFLAEDISWGALSSFRDAKYDGYTVSSEYVPMLDGVRMAVDIHLPKGLPSTERVPTLLFRTRYWREMELVEGAA